LIAWIHKFWKHTRELWKSRKVEGAENCERFAQNSPARIPHRAMACSFSPSMHCVPAVSISVQFSNVRDNAGSNRVQVYIANQFPQIGIFLADNGFVPILKKVTMALVPAIETNRVSGKQSSHQSSNRLRPSAKQKVSVVRFGIKTHA